MHSLHHLKTTAVVLTALGLGAGLTLPVAGCSSAAKTAAPIGVQSSECTTATSSIPPLDARASAVFETATFALG